MHIYKKKIVTRDIILMIATYNYIDREKECIIIHPYIHSDPLP